MLPRAETVAPTRRIIFAEAILSMTTPTSGEVTSEVAENAAIVKPKKAPSSPIPNRSAKNCGEGGGGEGGGGYTDIQTEDRQKDKQIRRQIDRKKDIPTYQREGRTTPYSSP